MNHSNISVYDNVKSGKLKEQMSNRNETNDDGSEEEETEMSALAQFAHATRFMTRIGGLKEGSLLEPLPFTDYSLFVDKYEVNSLRINNNLFTTKRYTFLPNTAIGVSVSAKKREIIHFIHPYV